MGAPQYEQAGADIGGTGTTNTIPRWTGASTLGDSGLIDDGTQVYTTTRKLAVGSASAVSELTAVTGAVAPTANPPALQTLHGNNQNVFRAKYTSSNFNVSGNWLGLGFGYHDNYMKAAIIAEAKDGSGRANMHIALNAAATSANVGLADARLTVTYDGYVGIGTASPLAQLTLGGVSNSTTKMGFQSVSTEVGSISMNSATGEQRITAGFTTWGGFQTFYTNGLERARIDSSGNLILNTANTGATIQAAGSQQGLKLPATPGNADTQTLDCYQEGTWTPTLTSFGGTTPTATIARYTRVGRLVTVHVLLTATGGNQFSSTAATTLLTLPLGMTPAADAAGSTSNSVIGADGPCVAYTNGNLYVPTFALRTANTILTVTYSV